MVQFPLKIWVAPLQVRVGVKTNHPAYEFGASTPTNMVRAFEYTHRVAFLELNGVSHVPLPPKISDGLGLVWVRFHLKTNK